MRRGSFDDRVAKCIAQFRAIETRSSERIERLGMNNRAPLIRATGDTPSKG